MFSIVSPHKSIFSPIKNAFLFIRSDFQGRRWVFSARTYLQTKKYSKISCAFGAPSGRVTSVAFNWHLTFACFFAQLIQFCIVWYGGIGLQIEQTAITQHIQTFIIIIIYYDIDELINFWAIHLVKNNFASFTTSKFKNSRWKFWKFGQNHRQTST